MPLHCYISCRLASQTELTRESVHATIVWHFAVTRAMASQLGSRDCFSTYHPGLHTDSFQLGTIHILGRPRQLLKANLIRCGDFYD